MSTDNTKSTVAIVMCTYNGSEHLNAQMESLIAQQWPIVLYVFDDASSDATVEMIQRFSDQLTITISVNEKNLGYVANFESGITKVLDEGFDYIALSDQDDVWSHERISAGMQQIQQQEAQSGKHIPVMAHSDLTMIGANNQVVHASFFAYRRYTISAEKSLATILGQNGVMGNTVLMNRALATLALPFPNKLHVHDYWLAVLAELYGHRELVSSALVSYRIHNDNASNPSDSIKFGLAKLVDGKSWAGFIDRDYRLPFKEDSRLGSIQTLLSHSGSFPELTKKQRDTLNTFQAYLEFKQSRMSSFYSMLKGGFFRPGIRHRIRLAYSTLLTQRYNKS